MKFTASLPAAPEIPELYRNWQSLYWAFYQRLGLRIGNEETEENDDTFEIEEAYVTNVSEVDFKDSCQPLTSQINAWLHSTEFRKIEQQLRTQLKPSEEIRFIIETDDDLLRRLPWYLWNFFEDYPLAEVALSASDYQKPTKFPTTIRIDKIRILAIFGNNKGIDISQDRTCLENLSGQAEIECLVEPKLDQFNDQLWHQDWDILFFAGHSSSQEKGCLQLNQTDTITLDQLKYALKQAISRGLKLAIFNSCDGLGLAQQLQDLQIPQVIVMREPVPDVVAQEFLKHFLAEFSRGQSLYVAVRFARERLQAREGEYPCATWLPIICTNPAEPPMIWQQQGIRTEAVDEAGDLATPPLVSARATPRKVRVTPRNATVANVGSESLSRTGKRNPSARHRFPITNNHRLRNLLVASVLVAALVMGVRHLGMLQPSELKAYDHLMQLRSANEKPDPRLLIVTIDDADIQYQLQKKMNMRWSLSDQALAQLLQKLEQYQPSAIGIDIYRDFSADPDYPDLATRLRQDERLFAVCKVSAPSDGVPDGTSPPPEVPKERQSFSDFVADADRVARRQLLHLTPPLNSPCAAKYAFSYLLARHYLNEQGFKADINPEGNLQIGNVVFKQLESHSSGYQGVDESGYQLLLNYRSLPSLQKIADQVALRDVLSDRINPELLDSVKNRIILIGVTAPSTSDYWETPFRASAPDEEKQIPGVFVQAQMVSHILSPVLDGRPLFWWWTGWVEALWVWGWSLLGGVIAWRIRQPLYLGLAIAVALLILFMICFGIFTQAGWIPLVPSALALVSCAVVLKVLPRLHTSNSKKHFPSEL
jgi:CHASE2 domain-containing sensor protein